MHLFTIIKQQKFTLRFNTLNIKQLKKQLSDKNPTIEISVDHRLQG